MNREQIKELAYRYPEEILYPYSILFPYIGFDGICSIADEFGGAHVYIPTARTIFSKCVFKQLRHEYNGANSRELRKKFGYSESTVRQLTRGVK